MKKPAELRVAQSLSGIPSLEPVSRSLSHPQSGLGHPFAHCSNNGTSRTSGGVPAALAPGHSKEDSGEAFAEEQNIGL